MLRPRKHASPNVESKFVFHSGLALSRLSPWTRGEDSCRAVAQREGAACRAEFDEANVRFEAMPSLQETLTLSPLTPYPDGREGEATQARRTFHCPNAGWCVHRTRGPRLHRESGPAGKACVRVRCA